jgi:hypothetical protein
MEGGKRCTDFGDHYNPYGVSPNIYFFFFILKSNCCFGCNDNKVPISGTKSDKVSQPLNS